MSYWNGSHWVPEPPGPSTASRAPRVTRHIMAASLEASLVVLLLFGLIAGSALAAKGNGGGKGNGGTAGACTVYENVVTGAGLPIGELLNFMVTDSSGTAGRVLGFTDTGEWSVNVTSRSEPATYEFAGRTYGNGGTKYAVYARCSG